MVAVQAPHIARMLAGPAQRGIQPQIGGVHRRGLLHLPLLEQQRAVGMPGGLHPAPGLVVGQRVVQLDSAAQVGEGLVETPCAIVDLPVEHGGGDSEDVTAGVVEQIAAIRDPVVGRRKRLAFLFGLGKSAGGGIRHTPSVVDGGGCGAVQLRVRGRSGGDQVLPAAEPDQDVDPQRDERLEPVGHRRRLDGEQLGGQLTGEFVGSLHRHRRVSLEHRRIHDEVQVVRPVQRIEVQRTGSFDEPAVGAHRRQVGHHRVPVIAAQHVDVTGHVGEMSGIGHQPAQQIGCG